MGAAGQGAEAIAEVVDLRPHIRRDDSPLSAHEQEAVDDWGEYQRFVQDEDAAGNPSFPRASDVGNAPHGQRSRGSAGGGRASRYNTSSYAEERRRSKQEAKARFDAAGWLEQQGHHVVRNSRGATLSCPMPDHGDSDPSFSLLSYDDGWGWNCFGCRRKGDSIALVEKVTGCNPAEAIAEVHRFSGVEIPERRKGAYGRRAASPMRRGGGTLEATEAEAASAASGHRGRTGLSDPASAEPLATPAHHGLAAHDVSTTGAAISGGVLGPIPLALVRQFERISEADAVKLSNRLARDRIDGQDGLLMKWIGSRVWTEATARNADIHMAKRIYGRDENRVSLIVARHPFYGAGNRVLGWADRVQSRDRQRTGNRRWLANAGKPPPLVGAHTVTTQDTVLVAEGVSDWITLLDNAPAGSAALCVPGTGLGADASRELVALLRGRQVLVLGDRDVAGAGLGALLAAAANTVGMKILAVTTCGTSDVSALLDDCARVLGPAAARNRLRAELLDIVAAFSKGWIPSGHPATLRLL